MVFLKIYKQIFQLKTVTLAFNLNFIKNRFFLFKK